MLSRLHALLGGSSPVTGYLGSLVIVLDVINQVAIQQGFPHGFVEWAGFVGALATGLGLRFAKDANQSNAPRPNDRSSVVS